MKLILAATAVLAATAAPVHHDAAVALRTNLLSHHRAQNQVVLRKELPHFGDTECPCIGFDNIEGDTIVTLKGDQGEAGQDVSYPADLGSRCEPWDDDTHPSCKAGQTPGNGHGWCAQNWCYVDSCNCNIPILPKQSTYQPGTTYRGKPLFFSYNTCGGSDTWSDAVPEIGTPGCRCIGFAGQQGATEVTLAGGKKVDYPAEVGGACKAWDLNMHPDCKGKKPAKWCKASWCFVDPCECKLPGDVPPKISMYLPKATFTGKSIYYSYETCGEKDEWTKNNDKACVNQKSKDECNGLSRCAWTGARCVGKELVNHPLCQGAKKSAAGRASAGLALVATLAVAAGFA